MIKYIICMYGNVRIIPINMYLNVFKEKSNWLMFPEGRHIKKNRKNLEF
jgi:hypothetical protein